MKFHERTALILIDVQKGIDQAAHWGGNRNNPDAEKNIEKLLKKWRSIEHPIFLIQHASTSSRSPFYPGKEGAELKDFVKPRLNEHMISKSAANAFIGTSLLQDLAAMRLQHLVIAGFVTNNSVESTVRMAGDMGYRVTIVSDATACFDKTGVDGTVYPAATVHAMSLANLLGEYASVATTKEIID